MSNDQTDQEMEESFRKLKETIKDATQRIDDELKIAWRALGRAEFIQNMVTKVGGNIHKFAD
jgi:hypothetical protein